MYDDQGSGSWGKKAFFVVIGVAVPLVLWLLNRNEEAAETSSGRSTSTAAPPRQDSSPVATTPLADLPVATTPLASSPAPTPVVADPIVATPFASVASPPAQLPNTAPEAREQQPAPSAANVERAAAATTSEAAAPPASIPDQVPVVASPAEVATQTAAPAADVVVEGAPVQDTAPPAAAFAKGFPCDIEISDADNKSHAAHLLELDLKTARVRCERPLQTSEKVRMTIKTRSGDTITPTGAITSVNGDEFSLKLLKINEGLRKRLQAFLDEQKA